jgi:hypothetical protein
MRSQHVERSFSKELKGNFNSQGAAIENSFNSMTIEEIRNSKPKSRLESFLRRKALEKRKKEETTPYKYK